MVNQADPDVVSGTPEAAAAEPAVPVELSEAERRARRVLIIGLAVAGVLMLGMIALLVFLSLDAYQATMAGAGPSPGAAVVGVLRDAAIIFVAFETLLIGVLLIILMLQVQALLRLLREEIQPMLAAINETLATVRGTTQFVSENVVSPVVKWSGYLAGLRRIARGIGSLSKSTERSSERGSKDE